MEAIPVLLAIPYATFLHRLGQGTLGSEVAGRDCPSPGCPGKLRLTSQLVRRGLVRIEGPKFVHEDVRVPLARCDGTKRGHRCRVLPADILPKKIFTLGAQGATMDAYRRFGQSLRKTMASFSGEAPHPSTLHGWLGGCGRYTLGRSTADGVLPVGALLEATRRQRSLDTLQVEPVPVPPARYRSEARREELEAAAGLIVLAGSLFANRPDPLAVWRGLILESEGVPAIAWRARIRTTAIQQRVRKPP